MGAFSGHMGAVTVTLEQKGAGTLLTLRHADLPDDDMGRQHQGGWQFVVGAIEARFAKRPSVTFPGR